MESSQLRRTIIKDLLLLTALAVLVLLPALRQTRHLKSRELRHAEIMREMAESGDYLVPTLLGKEYYDKPPVLHAVGAFLMKYAGGPSMAIARLPAALAAWLAVLVTYGVGRVLGDRATALIGAVALLSMPGFYGMARNTRPDMILCLAVVLSSLCLLWGMKQERSGQRALAFALAGLSAGVGILSKGPWGVVFPVLLAFMVWFAKRDWKLPRIGWGMFAVGLSAVVAAWAVPVYMRDGGRYLNLMLHQTDLQVGEAPWDPLNRYLLTGLALTLPLSLFLPWAILDWRRRGYSPTLAFAFCVWLFFMVIPKKRPHYLLPMYPFLGLAVAQAIVRECASKRWLRQAATVSIGLSLLGVPVYYGFVHRLHHPQEDPDLQVARQVVAQIAPNSRVYVLSREGGGEAMAWIGHRKIQVVSLDDNLAELEQAPTGSYLAVRNSLPKPLASGCVSPRLKLLAEVPDGKNKILLFRVGESKV